MPLTFLQKDIAEIDNGIVKPKCQSFLNILTFDTTSNNRRTRGMRCDSELNLTDISVTLWFFVLLSFTNKVMHIPCECQLLTTFSPIAYDFLCKTCKTEKVSHFNFISFILNALSATTILYKKNDNNKKNKTGFILNNCVFICGYFICIHQKFCWQGLWLNGPPCCTVIQWMQPMLIWSSA